MVPKQQDASSEYLKKILHPGDTVYTLLDHVSKSGVFRVIRLFISRKDSRVEISYDVARACSMKYSLRHDGIEISGGGMDMGFELVYNLSSVLFAEKFFCVGQKCPSNDHSNGDRNYRRNHKHSNAGYALRQQWL